MRAPAWPANELTNNPDLAANAALARRAAAEGTVLLKNSQQTLPLSASIT